MKLLRSSLLAVCFAATAFATLELFDEFKTNELGIGPTLPVPYLGLIYQAIGIVSQSRIVKVGGLKPQSGSNYAISSAVFTPQPAQISAASTAKKITLQGFYFGFLANDANGNVDVAIAGTLTVQGYDKNGGTVPGAKFQQGFQPSTVATVDQNPLAKALIPKGFPAAYRFTFTYTSPATTAVLIDNLGYLV